VAFGDVVFVGGLGVGEELEVFLFEGLELVAAA
jgi:hypothetical protein